MGMKEEVAEILLSTNALSVDIANPYKYESGILSPVYTDCRTLVSHPVQRKRIIDLFENIIKGIKNGKFDVIAAAGPDSIPFASYLSKKITIPMIFIRKAKKQHGKQKQIEGEVKEGSSVLLMKDIISTGDILKQSIEVLRERKCKVYHCLSVFNNNVEKSNKELADLGVENVSLTDLDALLMVALIHKKITDEELEEVQNWIGNPLGWISERKKRIEKSLKENEKRAAEILLEKKAVTLNPKNPYKYVSGVFAPIYTDCRILLSNPKEWREVINSLAFVIKNEIGLRNIEVLAGTAVGAIPHASFLAEELDLPMVYVNKVEKEHGKQTKVEGNVSKGDRAVVIEDLVSTGGSSITTVGNLRESRAVTGKCVTIFNYGFPKTGSVFEEAGVKLYSLCNLKTLLDVAVRKKYIKPEEKKIVEEWIKDPENWGKKMGFEAKGN
ncbi:MAG: hypothetical protein JSV92_00460 [archaeon]|nr:MAG: hypothetical protein JSV92_00460 [archaeon]